MMRPSEYVETVEAIAEEVIALPKEQRARYLDESAEGSEWVFKDYKAREIVTGADMAYDGDGMQLNAVAYRVMRRDIEVTVARLMRERLMLSEEQRDEIASRLTDIEDAVYAHEDGNLVRIDDGLSAIRSILGIKEGQ